MRDKTWKVYILECLDGSFYTGVTNDLDKRMAVHKSGKGSKYVKSHGFSHLVAFKECEDKSDACKCEYFIKTLPKWEKLDWFRKN
jgi:putative endonuclease